jgi:hypothetical protein
MLSVVTGKGGSDDVGEAMAAWKCCHSAEHTCLHLEVHEHC